MLVPPPCSYVDKYRKIKRISEGSYGVVYKARNGVTGEVVALKRLKVESTRSSGGGRGGAAAPTSSSGAGAAAAAPVLSREWTTDADGTHGYPVCALREILVLRQLRDHRNVVQLKEVVANPSNPLDFFVVMEFVEHDLHQILQSKCVPFQPSEIKTLLRQLLGAVLALHKLSYVHRDIKSQNLLLGNDGLLKLADFGMARRMDFAAPVCSCDFCARTAAAGAAKSGPAASAAYSSGRRGPDAVSRLLKARSILRPESSAAAVDGPRRLPVSFVSDNGCDLKAHGAGDYPYVDMETCVEQQWLSTRVVTLWYRPPELLLGCKEYGPWVDMWSVGCVFAELVRREPLFPGKGELETIDRVFRVLGAPPETSGVYDLPQARSVRFDRYVGLGRSAEEAARACSSHDGPQNLSKHEWLRPLGLGGITVQARDLLARMLELEPRGRISAAAALVHPYFAEFPPGKHPSLFPTFPENLAKREKNA